MKSGKRFLFFLLPVVLYLLGALGFLFVSESLHRDLSVPTASDRTSPASAEDLRVDLNRVDYDELVNIPSIGPKLARQILQYRLEHGDFESVKELDLVPGIGEKKLELLMDYVYVED